MRRDSFEVNGVPSSAAQHGHGPGRALAACGIRRWAYLPGLPGAAHHSIALLFLRMLGQDIIYHEQLRAKALQDRGVMMYIIHAQMMDCL